MTAEIDPTAPGFKGAATGDKTLSLADFAGQKLVLYFYPRDNTPGCTQEGEAFRDLYQQFRDANTAVVGVSRDSLRKHENFRTKNAFSFDLISDADEKICKDYGVLKKKTMYGRQHIGIERSTFLIDAQGVIRKTWRGVKVADHANEVLAAAQALD